MIFFIVLLPAFLSILAATATFTLIVVQRHKIQEICKRGLLSTQEDLRKKLVELTRLNPLARQTRIEWAAARASGYAPAIAAAKLKQQMVALKQKSILVQAWSLGLKNRTQIVFALKAHATLAPTKVEVSAIPFAVKAQPVGSVTPDYLPQEPLWIRQTATARWQSEIHTLVPKWILQLLPNLQLQAKCAATIDKKGGEWVSRLRTVK